MTTEEDAGRRPIRRALLSVSDKTGLIDFAVLFGRSAPNTIEIGFGNGDHLASRALAEPERSFLGVEVHLPGIGHLLRAAAAANLSNLRVIEQDAVELLRGVPILDIGIGGGALVPISQAVLLESFPPEKRGVAMATFGMGVIVAPILGWSDADCAREVATYLARSLGGPMTGDGSIAVGGTAVQYKALTFTYDWNAAKWYPNYVA